MFTITINVKGNDKGSVYGREFVVNTCNEAEVNDIARKCVDDVSDALCDKGYCECVKCYGWCRDSGLIEVTDGGLCDECNRVCKVKIVTCNSCGKRYDKAWLDNNAVSGCACGERLS